MFLGQTICLWRRLGPRRDSLSLAQCRMAFGGGLLLGLLPTMIISQIVYGAPWVAYYPALRSLGHRPGGLDFLSPHCRAVLWSTNKGLFTWPPSALAQGSLAGSCVHLGLARPSLCHRFLGVLARCNRLRLTLFCQSGAGFHNWVRCVVGQGVTLSGLADRDRPGFTVYRL